MMKNEVKSGVIITITVIIVLVVVYLTTAIFMTGEIGSRKTTAKNNTEEQTNDNISNLYDNMIIASKTFEQPNDEYMVIFFSQKSSSETLNDAISSYDSIGKETKLYKVNLDEVINKFVVSQESNNNASNYSELKINDTTLITIKNKEIASYVVGDKNVIDKLK